MNQDNFIHFFLFYDSQIKSLGKQRERSFMYIKFDYTKVIHEKP